MKKLSLVLALLVTGCVVETESTETAEDVYYEDAGGSMPGNGNGDTYSSDCGIYVEEFVVNGETHYMEIPVFCDPYWWMHTPPGDPPPKDKEIPYSNPAPQNY